MYSTNPVNMATKATLAVILGLATHLTGLPTMQASTAVAPCMAQGPSSEYLKIARAEILDTVTADGSDISVPRLAGPMDNDPVLWPNNTLVFEFDQASLSDSPLKKASIKPDGWMWDMRESMKILSEQTCIQFRERTQEDKDKKVHYVRMGAYQLNACWSAIGYYPTRTVDAFNSTYQRLNVWVNFADIANPAYRNGSCGWSTGMHEIMHSLGVYHE